MPISEDEYDHNRMQGSNPSNNMGMGMSKAELRRSNKPIMEKKRRARINHCLNELKSLILDAMKKDPARHSKLEKADILEMTVKHLQSVQRQQLAVAVATDPSVLHKFKTGFSDCAGEVSRYIGHLDGVEPAVKQRLIAHLTNCVSGLQQISPFTFPGMSAGFTGSVPMNIPGPTSGNNNIPIAPFSGDVNNNQNTSGRIQMGGVQLIPSRLPTGELALIMPNSNNLPFFPPGTTNFPVEIPRTSHPSAFSSVNQSKHTSVRPASPPLSPSSSISSYDDSLTSDYPVNTTPPLQIQVNQNMASSFPTPPSQNKPSTVTRSVHMSPQQPHISSTTISPETNRVMKPITFSTQTPLSVITNRGVNEGINLSKKEIQYVNKKRPYPVDVTDRLLVVASQQEVIIPHKVAKYSYTVSSSSSVERTIANNETGLVKQVPPLSSPPVNRQPPQASNNDMWRPW